MVKLPTSHRSEVRSHFPSHQHLAPNVSNNRPFELEEEPHAHLDLPWTIALTVDRSK